MATTNIEVTSTCIYYISKILNEELSQGYINNIQQINEEYIKIKIHKQQTKQLIIMPNICFLSNYSLQTLPLTGFIKYLRNTLYNQKIKEIKQDKNNRVIYLKLDKYYLIFELFSNSNIILTDTNYKIISSKQKETWKDRTIKKNEIYLFPNGEDIKEKNIQEILNQTKKTIGDKPTKKQIISYFVKNYNISPYELEKIEYTENTQLEEYIGNLKKIFEYKNPKFIIDEYNGKKIISVTENQKETYENNIFEEINQLFLKEYIKKKIEGKNIKKQKIENVLKQQIESKQTIERKIGELDKEAQEIYNHLTLIDDINKQIQIATNKKIDKTEIINKLNNYFLQQKICVKIKDIDLKNKTYTLVVENN
ncbi:MAG TPA: NFACT family protein [archaeon]|nr:NFACT family protein [archaeon]HRT02472.1 NFACT family protein [Candidatus Diapherotrites archaeon]